MIQNYKCTECDHRFVCKKMSVLEKFDDESKKYINIDISIIKCLDFVDSDIGEDDGR